MARRKKRGETVVSLDAGLVQAQRAPLRGPLRGAAVGEGLARQQALVAPAKLALDRNGGVILQTEIPRVLPRLDCEKLAGEALDCAETWLDHTSSPSPSEATADVAAVEEALAELPWDARRAENEPATWLVHATLGAEFSTRITVAAAGTGLRASSSTSLRVSDPCSEQAFVHFALEANRRLRFARVSVAAGEDAAHVVWDAILPGALPPAAALGRVVEAVVFAQSVSRPAFTALTSPQLADLYLRLRNGYSTRAGNGAFIPGAVLFPRMHEKKPRTKKRKGVTK